MPKRKKHNATAEDTTNQRPGATGNEVIEIQPSSLLTSHPHNDQNQTKRARLEENLASCEVDDSKDDQAGRTSPANDHKDENSDRGRSPSLDGASGTLGGSAPLPQGLESLRQSHTVYTMSILSSAKMTKKIKSVMERVTASSKERKRPNIVMLHAYSSVASKMIGIVEIAKKTLQSQDCALYEYTVLQGVPSPEKSIQRTKTRKRKDQTPSEMHLRGEEKSSNDDNIDHEHYNDTDDDDFEMQTERSAKDIAMCDQHQTHGHKQHEVPILTIFLCAESVPLLKRKYGEQSTEQLQNAREKASKKRSTKLKRK